MTPFMAEDTNQLRSPKVVIEIGPKMVTTMPPPIKIRIHIENKKPNNPAIIMTHP